jgi:4-amino-4-deoxy-L-arabinose transferase-like glycosyltransferase
MKRLLNSLFGNWSRTLFTIFMVGLITRGVFILTLQDGFYFPDSSFYSKAAVSLITNGELGKFYNRPPGYPVFLASIYVLFGESILAVRIVESVMGAFLAVVIALLGRRIGGEVVGAISGILWTIYPLGVFIAGLVYPTTLLTTLLACGLLCFLPHSDEKLSPKRIFFGGIIWGLAALTSPVVIATIGAIIIWMIYYCRTNRVLSISVLFLGSALTVVPWTIRDFYVYDRLVVVEPRVVEHLPVMRVPGEDVKNRSIHNLVKQPGAFAEHFQREFVNFWKLELHRITMDWPSYREALHKRDSRIVRNTIFSSNGLTNIVSIVSTAPLFLFAIIGTGAMLFDQERRRHLALLWLTILSFAVVYSMFHAKTRYRIPIEPYIIILSAYGLMEMWRMLAARKVNKFEVRRSKFDVEAKVKADAMVGDVRSSKFEVRS